MDTPATPAPASAEALASDFQVAELEPRLENAWLMPGGRDVENPVPGR